jgi:hypothetical protein
MCDRERFDCDPSRALIDAGCKAVSSEGGEPTMGVLIAELAEGLYYIIVFTALPLLFLSGQWLYRNNARVKEWCSVDGQAQRVAIRDARGGQVHLEGTAQQARDLLRSPLYGAPCLAYSFEACAVYPTGIGTHRGSVFSETKGVPFWLTDPTGSVLVHPTSTSKLELRDEAPQRASGGDQRNWLIQALMAQGVTLFPAANYEFVERRLDAGEPCGVYGEYSPSYAGHPGVAQGQLELYITDSDTATLIAELRKKRLLALAALAVGIVELAVLLPGLLIVAAIFG